MKNILFVLLIVVLLVGTGVVLARPIDQDGNPSAYPITTPTAEPYPIVWPTATDTPYPTAVPAPPEPTRTPPPVVNPPDGPPYFPSE